MAANVSNTSTSPSSGVLTVISDGTSASVNLSGNYTSASFHITDGAGGTVKFLEVQPSISPPNIPSLIDFSLAGKTVLLANYIAAAFAVDGHDGTLATGPQQTEPQTLLTHPARG